MRPYYILVVKQEGRWGVEFGDYDRQTVEQEREDVCYQHDGPQKQNTRVVMAASSKQAAIDTAVSKLNR